jgi:geranylgeranyl pyrophosphate synthase
MPLTVSTLDAFESYLVSALNAIPADANRLPIRDHFALDDLAAQRGKRMRPRILLTVTLAEGGNAEDAFAAAAALEILHNFSLVHDDIEDLGHLWDRARPHCWRRDERTLLPHALRRLRSSLGTACARVGAMLAAGALSHV